MINLESVMKSGTSSRTVAGSVAMTAGIGLLVSSPFSEYVPLLMGSTGAVLTVGGYALLQREINSLFQRGHNEHDCYQPPDYDDTN